MLFSHSMLIPLSTRQRGASLRPPYVHKDPGARTGLKLIQGHTAGQGQSLDKDPGLLLPRPMLPPLQGHVLPVVDTSELRVEQDRAEGGMEKGTCWGLRHWSSQTCHPPGRISPPALLSPRSCEGRKWWFSHNQRLQEGVPVLACGMPLSGLVHSLPPVRPAGSFSSVRGLGRLA